MSATLYRAQFATATGRVRRMTFAHGSDPRAAWRFAELWELRDDKLQAVAVVRALNPQQTFNLTSGGMQ